MFDILSNFLYWFIPVIFYLYTYTWLFKEETNSKLFGHMMRKPFTIPNKVIGKLVQMADDAIYTISGVQGIYKGL